MIDQGVEPSKKQVEIRSIFNGFYKIFFKNGTIHIKLLEQNFQNFFQAENL